MARILLVEDDVHMLRVLSMWLRKNGHQILEAHDGREATSIIDRESVDIVVSDINMPHMGGIELALWIRNERQLQTPIILLSSRCDQSQIASNLVPYGVTVHPKPFSPSRLVAQIESSLNPRLQSATPTANST